MVEFSADARDVQIRNQLKARAVQLGADMMIVLQERDSFRAERFELSELQGIELEPFGDATIIVFDPLCITRTSAVSDPARPRITRESLADAAWRALEQYARQWADPAA